MDDQLTKSISEKLLERKEQLEAELATFATKTTKDAGGWKTRFMDMGRSEDENAAEVATYSDNLSLEQTLEKALRDVNNALSRIAAGTYGTCRYCGEPIPEKRLLARPTSSSCVQCKVAKKLGG